jgi:class 3 adenylate cyclase
MESELRNTQGHAAAGRVVIEASRIRSSEELEMKLRAALRDPSLRLLLWSPGEKVWLDGDGTPVEFPSSSPSRTVTRLDVRGLPSVALDHDPSVLSDPDVTDAVLSAVRFVVERQRLATDPSFHIDRARLPVGFLTHLFTDIEGSTELLTELTDGYAEVLAKVRRVIRQEVQRREGHEVSVTGDETYSVFEDATAAVDAAVGVQRTLAGVRWPAGVAVRVRVGIHSGDVALSEGDYVGLAVNTAARVMSVGHGGQILLTPAVRAAMPATPDGLSLRSLGVRKLKDLPDAIELFQVEAEGLDEMFPPLRNPAAG